MPVDEIGYYWIFTRDEISESKKIFDSETGRVPSAQTWCLRHAQRTFAPCAVERRLNESCIMGEFGDNRGDNLHI